VDGTELADVQTYLVGSLPLSLETNEGVAGAILNMARYELGLDYLSRYPDLVNQVTPRRIQAAARKWLDADNLAVGIAGSGATGSSHDDSLDHIDLGFSNTDEP
jgi:zinc protease